MSELAEAELIESPLPPPPAARRANTRARRLVVTEPAARPRQDITTGTTIAVGLLLVAGVIALFCAYLLVGSGLAANRQQDVMFTQMKTSLKQATVPVANPLATGTPLGILAIPELGIDQVFVEGSSAQQTMSGPGLRHDSVLPGQAGLSVLVGRRTAFGGAFKHLDRLHTGDKIDVATGQGKFKYAIDLVRTSDAKPSQITQCASRLTLLTSDPAYRPFRTLQVSGCLIGNALPASTGQSTVAADNPGQGSGRPIALLLWAQLLLALTALVTWAAVRLPRTLPRLALWIGAVPVLLAVAWNVFENLALLLPNTL